MSARSLMSLVRQVLQRVTESARYAAPAAKLCITIIEVRCHTTCPHNDDVTCHVFLQKEQQETFLESLLNTCTQWYQERDRHLRNSAAPAVLLPGAPVPSCPRWVSFMTFLNEMYCQVRFNYYKYKEIYTILIARKKNTDDLSFSANSITCIT